MTIPAHAELIHAFADGKTLQFQYENRGWIDWPPTHCPDFDDDSEWRIKPTPKVTRYLAYENENGFLHWRNSEVGAILSEWKRIPSLNKEVTEEE